MEQLAPVLAPLGTVVTPSGLRHGRSLAVLALNTTDTMEVQFACFRLGAVALPVPLVVQPPRPVSKPSANTGGVADNGRTHAAGDLLTLEHQRIPPTINYQNPDPELDLNYTPNTSIRRDVNAVLSNSFGFGGQNIALIAGAM